MLLKNSFVTGSGASFGIAQYQTYYNPSHGSLFTLKLKREVIVSFIVVIQNTSFK